MVIFFWSVLLVLIRLFSLHNFQKSLEYRSQCLLLAHFRVEPARPRQELCVRPALDDRALSHHEDPVCAAYRAQPVGDGDRGAALLRPVQGRLFSEHNQDAALEMDGSQSTTADYRVTYLVAEPGLG